MRGRRRPRRLLTEFARLNGWDKAYQAFAEFDLPTYVGLPTF